MRDSMVRSPAAALRYRTKMLAWTIARRFSRTLRRNSFARFTSVVAVASVALGTIAVCLSQSILAGYDEIIQHTATRFGAHLTIQRADGNPYSNVRDMARSIRSVPGVSSVSSTIRHETLVKCRSHLDGAVVVGLPEQHLNHAYLPLLSTRTSAVGRYDVLVGSGLARRLNAHVGDSLTLITRTPGTERPMIRRVVINSLFTSGMSSYDEHAIVTSFAHARHLLRLDSSAASMLMITCVSDADESAVVQALKRTYSQGNIVLTYRDHFAAMWNWIDLQRKPIPVIMSLIAIVSMFTVVTTVLLSIVEKIRSLAVLATLGMSPRQLALITALRVVSTSLIGVCLGVAISMCFIVVQREYHLITLDGNIYYVRHLPVAFDVLILMGSSLLIFLAACVASIVPMIITVRIRPMRALRFR